MSPFIARRSDTGEPVVVLGVVTRWDSEVQAIVSTPTGGRVWLIPLTEIYDALPAANWPVGWDEVWAKRAEEVPA